MEDKEERICICKLEGNATDSVCGGSMTRQEAIDKMSMAWCNREFKNNASAEDIDYCDRIAETMLNALLGVEK